MYTVITLDISDGGVGFLNLFFYCFYWAAQGVLSRQCPTLIHSNLSSFQGLEALSDCFIPMRSSGGDGRFESGFLQTPSVWVRPAVPGCTPPWPWSQDLILAQLFIPSSSPFQQSGYPSDGVHFIDTSVPLGLSQKSTCEGNQTRYVSKTLKRGLLKPAKAISSESEG